MHPPVALPSDQAPLVLRFRPSHATKTPGQAAAPPADLRGARICGRAGASHGTPRSPRMRRPTMLPGQPMGLLIAVLQLLAAVVTWCAAHARTWPFT